MTVTAALRVVGVMALLAMPGLAFQSQSGSVGQTPPPTTTIPGFIPATPAPTAQADLPHGAMSGVVIDGSTGAPVPGTLVYLTSPTSGLAIGAQTRQLTDDKGRFAFVNLPGDAFYTLSASKFGYLNGGYGRDTSPSDSLRSIRLRPDEWSGNLRVTIWRPGAISGTVRDENGEPVVGVFVRVLVRYRLYGRNDLGAGPVTVTDDRGEYRIAGLPPGQYLVEVPSVQASMPARTPYTERPTNAPDGGIEFDDAARLVIGRYPVPPPPVNGRRLAYPIAFHPSTSSISEATVVDLKYGDERTNTDIRIAPVPSARVSGVVEGPPEALNLLTLRLLPAGMENLGHGSEVATALVDAGGQFTFLNVPAGTYVIDAPARIYELSLASQGTNRVGNFPSPPGIGGWGRSTDAAEPVPGLQFGNTNFRGSAQYSGRGSVTVGGSDLNGVVVRLRQHLTMTGRVVLEADPAQPAPAPTLRFTMALDPAGGEIYLGMPRSAYSPDAPPLEFGIPSVMPGSYWLRVQGDSSWLPKSIVWKGRDYLNAPFDTSAATDLSGVVVTVTNSKPTLSGAVHGNGTIKPEDCIVVVFTTDRTQWRNAGFSPLRLKSTTVTDNGTYQFTTLPAGDYFVAAIPRTNRTTWRDPTTLAQLEVSASRVTLNWGAKNSQDVNVVVIK